MGTRSRLLAASALLGFACGVGPLSVAAPDVNPAMVPRIAARAPVSVRGLPRGKPPYALGIGSNATVDDDVFTEALVEKVSRALSALGVGVTTDATRTIELSVTRVAARLAGVHYECAVDFNRRLGAADVSGLQGRGIDVDVERACSYAVREAATTALADGAIRNYLEAP